MKIVRLHPTRTYDLDALSYGESLTEAMEIAAKASLPVKGLGNVGARARLGLRGRFGHARLRAHPAAREVEPLVRPIPGAATGER